MSGQTGRYQRSPAGLVGAMIVLVAVSVTFVLVRDLTRDEQSSRMPAIDYARDAEFAEGEAGFEVLSPATLPDGWRATTARYVAGANERWHLGLLTDDDRYVGLEQSAGSAESMVETHVDAEAVPGDPVSVAGEDWSTWTDDGGDLALVREQGGATTLVVGHEVPSEDLVAFVDSLR